MEAARLQEAERSFIESLRPQFEKEGYEFRMYPKRNSLPDFMGEYQPDAIAVKPHHNVAIEVKSRKNRATDLSLQIIRQIFEGQPGWQLRVFYIGGDTLGSIPITTSTLELFQKRYAMAQELLRNEQPEAAFLIAWSLLEAAARIREADLRGRPYPPATIVQSLAMSGTIDADSERQLRSLVELRNRVVHGDLNATPTFSEVETVLFAAEAIVQKKD